MTDESSTDGASGRRRGRRAGIRRPGIRRPGIRRRWPIALVLVGGFGGLVLLAVTAVLVVGLASAGRNTFALLGDNADLVLNSVELRLRQRLREAERVAAFVASRQEEAAPLPVAPASGPGGLSAVRRAGASDEALRAALDLTPDITAIAYFATDGGGFRIGRGSGRIDGAPDEMNGMPRRNARELIEWAAGRTGPVWGAPSWSQSLHTSIIGVVDDARVGSDAEGWRTVGYAGVAVSLGDLSRFLFQLYADQGINAFVLYDREHVLAHPTLAARRFDFSQRIDGPPLPRIDEVDDLALAGLWREGTKSRDGLGHGIEDREVTVAGESYRFLLRPLSGAGPRDWIIGVWFPEAEVDREVRRLVGAGMAGLAILLVSVGVSLMVGRRISRSIGAFAQAAERVRALDFADIPPIPDSRLSEMARAAGAFNAMLTGLRWFEAYVPKALVLRLIERGEPDAGMMSEERVVTVMFTDIRGFSDMARSLSPGDTQALLSRHFTDLAAVIEAEGGTVDKFIGDAIMAFWGAPDEQPDHAARALRAAAAIGRVVEAANRERAGEPGPPSPIHVRVAVHSGPVVVGNIGSRARVNYTIIGDTVNVAARLEELCRAHHEPAEEVCVLVSDETVLLARDTPELPEIRCLGAFRLRGREDSALIWKLFY